MKYSGNIGYVTTQETIIDGKHTDKWDTVLSVRHYYGDVNRISRRLQSNRDSSNDDILVNNEFSIIADAFMYDNFQNIAYIEWMGTKWKVSTVDVQRPRMIFTLGGVYNEH